MKHRFFSAAFVLVAALLLAACGGGGEYFDVPLEGLGKSFRIGANPAEITIPDKSTVTSRDYIREQFRRLLGREPNTYELEAFAAEWDKDPAVGPRTIIRAIIASREYQSQ